MVAVGPRKVGCFLAGKGVFCRRCCSGAGWWA